MTLGGKGVPKHLDGQSGPKSIGKSGVLRQPELTPIFFASLSVPIG